MHWGFGFVCFEIGSLYVALAVLELTSLKVTEAHLPLSPRCLDQRCALPCPAGTEVFALMFISTSVYCGGCCPWRPEEASDILEMQAVVSLLPSQILGSELRSSVGITCS